MRNKSIKSIILLARRYPAAMGMVCFCLLISSILEALGISAIFPLITIILDTGSALPAGHIADFINKLATLGPYVLSGIVVAAFILKSLILSVAFTLIARNVSGFSHDLRISFIDAILKSRIHFILSKSLGENLSVLSNDSIRAATAYISAARVMAGTLQVSIYLAYALWLSAEATFLSILTAGILLITVKSTLSRSRKAGVKTTQHIHEITKNMGEALRGAKEAKATGREKYLEKYIVSGSDELRKAHEISIIVGQTLRNIQDPVTVASALVCLLIFKEYLAMEPGYIMFILVVYYRLMSSVNTMLADYQKFLGQEAGLISIQNGIEAARGNAERLQRKGKKPNKGAQDIEFKNVTFSYGKKQVLNGISFKVPAKELTMFKGESGRGKTTCIDMICDLIAPDSGTVIVGKDDLRKLNTALWRNNIGYVDQFPFLFNGTIRDNIILDGKNISEADIQKCLKLCHLDRFVDGLPEGLNFQLYEGGANISGGQRQRIAIARSVIRKPAYLILDEPTSALDQESAKTVLETLKNLSKTMSVIMISHSPTAQKYADKIIDFDKF